MYGITSSVLYLLFESLLWIFRSFFRLNNYLCAQLWGCDEILISEYNKNSFIVVEILWTGATDCTFIVSETYNDDRIITNYRKLKRMALDVLSAYRSYEVSRKSAILMKNWSGKNICIRVCMYVCVCVCVHISWHLIDNVWSWRGANSVTYCGVSFFLILNRVVGCHHCFCDFRQFACIPNPYVLKIYCHFLTSFDAKL
jgi:hypothetical protein